jgi:predicted permease
VRLLLSPILAVLIFTLLPADALTRRVLIIQSSGPTAVNAVILATKYDTHPEFVSSVILISTVLSVFTLSLLLAIWG